MTAAPVAAGAWMLRHAVEMSRDPLAFLQRCAVELGPVAELPVPGHRVLVVTSPGGTLRVLQGNHKGYGKDTVQYRSLALVTGQGLLVSDGADWLDARRRVQPAFHSGLLDRVAAHCGAAVARLAARWDGAPEGAVVDVDAAMMRVTVEIVTGALLSQDRSGPAGGADADRLVGAVVDALAGVLARARNPLPLPLGVPTPGNVRMRRAVRRLDDEVDAMLRARTAGGAGPATDDVLSVLLPGSTSSAVRDQVVTLVVAGHETVASALTWTCWLVAGDPAVAGRLAAEADDVLGGRPPCASDVARLGFARQVLDEALRLFPPAWVVSRKALVDDVVDGHDVPAGALVILSPYVLQRSAELWAHPERFDPGRFGPRTGGRPAPSAREGYLPFGAGPRLCIGREVALTEGVLVLADLARRFTFTRAPAQRLRVDPAVTLRPAGGLPLALRDRR
jgi:cytochrome P450